VDSGVFNTLQALASYTVNASQTATIYGMANVGKTGPYTYAYGGGTTGLGSSYANSDMIGAFYSYTVGNLNLVPEVQFQYAKEDTSIGIMGPSSNLGLALFGDYSFGTSPYSVGGWAEYFTSHSSAAANYGWFIGPDSQAIGAAVSPTWQYKDLFARANAGYLYLLHNTDATGASYDIAGGSSRGEFIGTLEAGLLF
jgi:hypothetical protein